MRQIGRIAALCILTGWPLANAGVIHDGGEFLVNTHTTSHQYQADVAAAGLGGFVVVWTGDAQDGFYSGIFGQRYDSMGSPVGGEFQVNTFTDYQQSGPAVAMHPSGGFVVAWSSYTQDGEEFGVFARRFDETGAPVGMDFQVNTWTTGRQYDPDVAIDDAGNFVVVWISQDQAGSGNSVFGQRFNGAGLPRGSEFQVDTYTAAYQYFPAVAAEPGGRFVVAWESDPLDGNAFGIAAQIYDSNGMPVAGNFQVNTYTTGDQGEPGIAMNAMGDFLVSWDGDSQDGSGDGVFAQLFDFDGTPVGSELQVNTYTTGTQEDPKIAADASGEFIVVWPSQDQDGSQGGVFGQIVDSFGDRVGAEFQVNAYTTGNQIRPSVAAGVPGSFAVVWQDTEGDGDGYSVVGQQLVAHSPELSGPAGPLDCSDPANPSTLPTFTWDTDTYEVFKLWMGSSPGFEKGTRVTSGDKAIKIGSWTPSKKKWKNACKKALTQSVDPFNPLMYVMVGGLDKDLPKQNPARKRESSVVEFGVNP